MSNPCIAHPRPTPSPVDVLLDLATDCKKAIALLRARGLQPIGLTINLTGVPTVQVLANYHTAAAIAREEACYYKFSHLERHGQFVEKPHGVKVVWVERGH